MNQTTFGDFGVTEKTKRKKKIVETVKVIEPTIPVEPEIDYDLRKRRTLAGMHLCYGSTWVYKYDDKILGIGDLNYYEDPIMGKKQMYRDIFHNFKVLRKLIANSKYTRVGKDYDDGFYELKTSKKEIEKEFHRERSYGHQIYELTEDGRVLDYYFADMRDVKVAWES